MTKLVYLDSSDFSNLSAPYDELSQENREILDCLREHNKAGTASFFMSAVHISEAVHAAESYKAAAVRRAELMRELCGTNILRLPNDLPAAELKKYLSKQGDGRLSLDEIRTEAGSWFGAQVDLNTLTENRKTIRRELLAHLDKLPREKRRKWKSELSFEKKSGREKWREVLKSGSHSATIPFPLNLIDKDFTIKWFLGEIANFEFRSRILEITHNPYVLFEYLVEGTENRQKLYDSLRSNVLFGDEASERKLVDAILPFSGSEIAPGVQAISAKFFGDPKILRKIISSHYGEASKMPDNALRAAINACPSLFTYMQILKSLMEARMYSYVARVRVGKTEIKKPRVSDFGDIMHSYYVPYFDIFRCDATFGALLKKNRFIRMKIADRISDIPQMLTDSSQLPGQAVA